MRDLELGRRLGGHDVTAADLLAFAARPLSVRAPYLREILRHANPSWSQPAAIRAAAIRALAGVRGVIGLRAVVAALGHPDDAVMTAAVEALRETARAAPNRFAHALFHTRAVVRRAALGGELAPDAAALALYLRADPVPELAALAAAIPWPPGSLRLGLDLRAEGAVTDAELRALVRATPTSELCKLIEADRGRSGDAIDAYLIATATTLAPPPGTDVLDAIAAVADEPLLAHLVATLHGKPAVADRLTVALLGALARDPARPGLLGACAALHPRLIGAAWLDPARVPRAAAGLADHGWPVKLPGEEAPALLRLPCLRAAAGGVIELESAVAIAGAYGGSRLRVVERAFGLPAIAAALATPGVGLRSWQIVCRLPTDSKPREGAWLAAVGEGDVHALLAGHAIGAFHGARLEALLAAIPEGARLPALTAALVHARDAGPAWMIDAVAARVVPRLGVAGLAGVLEGLLGDATPVPGAWRLLRPVLRAAAEATLAEVAATRLPAALVRALIAIFAGDDPPARIQEVAVARALVAHAEIDVRAWAAGVLAVPPSGLPTLPPTPASRALDALEQAAIAAAAPAELPRALAGALGTRASGLVAALALRAAAPSAAACAALLGSSDPQAEVVRALDRHGSPTAAFAGELDDATAAAWLRREDVALLVDARLWRWEIHAAAFARWIDTLASGIATALHIADAIGGELARATLWRAVAERVVVLRYRARARLAEGAPLELARHACAALADPRVGESAARIAVALIEAGAVAADAVRPWILERIADTSADSRALLERVVRTGSLPPPPPPIVAPPEHALVEQIRRTTDLDALAAWCADARVPLVHEAVLALLLAGAPGEARLAALIGRVGTLAAPRPLLESIGLWASEAAVATARAVAEADDLAPEWQFHLGLALAARGDLAQLPRVFAAARAPGERWFRAADWTALARLAPLDDVAAELVTSPHHAAYQPAVVHLVDPARPRWVREKLLAFLEIDDDRPLHLRRAAARRLLELGDLTCMPVILEHLADERADDWPAVAQAVPGGARWPASERLVDAALGGGSAACSETRLRGVLQLWDPAPPGLWARVLEGACTAALRRHAAARATTAAMAADRIGELADVFAWGVRRGVELTGQMFAIHLTSAETDLGYTQLGQGARIFVSALPLLRWEAHGQDVVEGLILHELGHHVYHRGEVAEALWKRAHAEGIGPLLNLIADEHLERNLRAVDPAYGDRLKRLGAYAFQHAPQELPIARLLDALRGTAARALIAAELGVAFAEDALRLRRGAVLTELARGGHPVARFARALRMVLGNREGDPRVEAALALCRAEELRQLDMPALYALTQRLAELFGGAVALTRVFGGPEGLAFGERDADVFGAGVSDEALQKEVERVLDPRARGRGGPGAAANDRLWINVAEEAAFDKITHVERLRGDPALHAALAQTVRRHATRLRTHLDALGMRWQPQTARTQGRALDRSRLRALVTRGDPRVLTAREPVRRTDLFLGVLVDCSGSMQAGQNIERAKKFAVLVAEACRGVSGVEARFFGFTDSAIFDAGDADDCAVTALRTDGGNNDAAALYHAASIATASRRHAKVLVMISDGLPTQCSVAALRALVVQLSRRRGIVCAQVAVRPLDEVCFPSYVVLDDASPDVAVARFGRLLAALTLRALGTG